MPDSSSNSKLDRVEFSGPIKAALWLLSVDKEVARSVMMCMNEQDIRAIGGATQNLARTTTPQDLETIHKEFDDKLGTDLTMHYIRGSSEYLSELAGELLGSDKANDLLSGVDPVSFAEANVDTMAAILADEHPQIIAATLANLAPDRAAEVLRRLAPEVHQEVVCRLATLTAIPRSPLAMAESVFSETLTGTGRDRKVNGIRKCAALLNRMDPDRADNILETLGSDGATAEVAAGIRQAMFTFEDLVKLQKKDLQVLLKEIQSEQLILALKTASPQLMELVLTCLSSRAGQMLKDDMEMLGAVKLSDVEAAQQALVSVALQLRSDGRIQFTVGEQGEVV